MKFSLSWAERSRATQGPSSALSATLTLTGAASTGGDLVYTVNRTSDLGAYTANYTTTATAKPGTYPLAIRFYAGADGAGSVVAQAQSGATILRDGTGIGTIGVANTITSVVVTPGQSVPSGASAQLAFTARDASGNLVAVSAGSGKWTQVSGTSAFSLSADGVATALQAGTGTVYVVVDGVTSATVPITVTSAPIASVVVDPGQFTAIGTPKQLTFIAKDAAGNVVNVPAESTAWTLVEGGNVISLSATGTATPLAVGTARVQVTVGGVTSAPETFTVNSGPVATVVVDANQSLKVGDSKQLTFTARDAQGNVVAVPAGSAVWENANNDADIVITPSGVVTGRGVGTAEVRVTVNGVVSPTGVITVNAS